MTKNERERERKSKMSLELERAVPSIHLLSHTDTITPNQSQIERIAGPRAVKVAVRERNDLLHALLDLKGRANRRRLVGLELLHVDDGAGAILYVDVRDEVLVVLLRARNQIKSKRGRGMSDPEIGGYSVDALFTKSFSSSATPLRRCDRHTRRG